MTERVYVVVMGDFFGSDLAGCLATKDEVLWQHVSSSESWLRRDLTDGFAHRRDELKRRFPDGYEVTIVGARDEMPEEIAHHFVRGDKP